jgi:hypothetical protein
MTEPRDTRLEVAGTQLPSAQSIAAVLRGQLNAAVLAERQRRGTVALPEDIWPMLRALGRVVETCGEYSRAFGTAAKEAKAVAEEELIDAVGESDGVPNQGMTVPDAEGDVVVSLDTLNQHEYDRDALFGAVAFDVMENLEAVGHLLIALETSTDAFTEAVTDLLILAFGRLCETGKFEPQVTKVRALLKTLGRQNNADGVVSSVTSTYRKRTIYKGVKVERKVAT